ncbi:hypothetical protein STRIP9103_06510 [Streptomyces ipomoeae 91-03]|uniref:Uncharacterized protein n=1 Tax=Streptomyces ipomoeae 91-03 TaxID=698759 RepID=L1L8G9_9ACTN|nr:hypothetical protein STRIP9103_06510 [Streptomyces ipomoeae 91-03]
MRRDGVVRKARTANASVPYGDHGDRAVRDRGGAAAGRRVGGPRRQACGGSAAMKG